MAYPIRKKKEQGLDWKTRFWMLFIAAVIVAVAYFIGHVNSSKEVREVGAHIEELKAQITVLTRERAQTRSQLEEYGRIEWVKEALKRNNLDLRPTRPERIVSLSKPSGVDLPQEENFVSKSPLVQKTKENSKAAVR